MSLTRDPLDSIHEVIINPDEATVIIQDDEGKSTFGGTEHLRYVIIYRYVSVAKFHFLTMNILPLRNLLLSTSGMHLQPY